MKAELIDKIIYSMVEGEEDFADAFDWACEYLEIDSDTGFALISQKDYLHILDEAQYYRG
jgi:hypothetical protein